VINRLSEAVLRTALAQFPVVVLTGARQTGKTTLVRWLLPDASYISLDNPADGAEARLAPAAFLASRPEPLILDEVQYEPGIFRHLKLTVDRDRRPGRFLLTSSQNFQLMAGATESLAGRGAVFTLPPLSASEVLTSASREGMDAFLWRSGFPELWRQPDLDRDIWLGSYVATYLERDVRQVLNVGDLRDFDRLLRAAALRAGQLLSYADLARDVGIAPNTARRWLSVLEASQQVFLLEPYHRHRTKRLIKAPKLYFADTGLLCFLLGFRYPADLASHALWGAVWENFVVSEVRKRMQATIHPPALWFWRTAHGDEVDLLIVIAPETFVAIECKTAEQVNSRATRGVVKLAAEYGPEAVPAARLACRTEQSYPIEIDAVSNARAVPVGGPTGLLEELAGWM
jgi:hypothetical protein